MFAERFGVIEAAKEKGWYAFGNMSDQKDLAPKNVVTGPVWNMWPTVDYILNQVAGGTYTAQDLKDFSMVGKGGATLAPINTGVTGGIPQALTSSVTAKENEIKSGLFRVDIDEAPPPASSKRGLSASEAASVPSKRDMIILNWSETEHSKLCPGSIAPNSKFNFEPGHSPFFKKSSHPTTFAAVYQTAAANEPLFLDDMASDLDPVVVMQGITKRFGMVLANDHVDFTLHQGDIDALLGENGAR